MKNLSSKGRIGLAAVAAALCVCVGVGSALAYYSDTTSAQGTLPYDASRPKTDITEEHDPNGPTNKVITVANQKDVVSLVRVKLYFANQDVTVIASGQDWAKGSDGWLYYTQPLQAKGSVTSQLLAAVKIASPTFPSFDITVEEQAVPALWDEEQGCYKGKFATAGADGDGTAEVLMAELVPLGEGIQLEGAGPQKPAADQEAVAFEEGVPEGSAAKEVD